MLITPPTLFCDVILTPVLFKVYSIDQLRQYHLAVCYKCKLALPKT